jgi:hypothetical protein
MFLSLSALFVFISFLTLKAGSMYKALLVALIGLFSSFSSADYRWRISEHKDGSLVTYHTIITSNAPTNAGPIPNALVMLSPYFSITYCGLYTGSTYECRGSDTSLSYRFKSPEFTSGGSITDPCSVSPEAPSCPKDTDNYCKDGSVAPNGDFGLCPTYTCEDGEVVETPSNCSTPFQCPDGSTPPNNSVANCPLNCDILSGGGGPECDTEEPPNGYCSETQTPIFDDCQYSPDDPRNPDNQPDPEDHCEQFPDSVSCNTELPELPDTDFCKKYPNALSCQTPEIPDLGTDTNPPPAGGTGVGTDTGTGTGVTPPPPEPPPTNSDSPSASTDARLDSLRYDISRLHSGLNYQTGIIATGLTGVAKQLQANGGKIDRSNTLLDGINKNLDVLNGGLKGDALTSGNFDVEGGINSALGITGNESIADLTDEPVTLESYREDFQPFLTTGQCPQNLPVTLTLFGSNLNFVFYYQPVCDLMGIIGSILNWAVWLSVPFIVFGRRRAS